MKIPFSVLALATFVLSATASDSTNRLNFAAAGFSIAPLESSPGSTPYQALMMMLPVTDNFAANVNVQIQPYPGTLDEYTTLTLQQFKDAEMKVIQQKRLSKSVQLFEYSGEMQGKSLHWYARAEKFGDKVYLATATSTADQWRKEGPKLRDCIDSFRSNGGDATHP